MTTKKTKPASTKAEKVKPTKVERDVPARLPTSKSSKAASGPSKRAGTSRSTSTKPAPKAVPTPPVKPAKKATPLVAALCTAFADKKAEDLRVLDVSDLSTITDFLVVATGNSETHLRALRIEADRVLKEFGTHIVGRDTQLESGWTVVDAFDVMVHLFTAEKREHYRLEHLWRDADEVSVEGFTGEPKKKKTR